MLFTVAKAAVSWLFGDEIIQYVLYAALGLVVFGVLEAGAAAEAIFSQPWGQWWLAGQLGPQFVNHPSDGGVSLGDGTVVIGPGSGGVTSVAERYRLAVQAGFSVSDAIPAVAISLAEDNSGDPLVQHHNTDGSVDTGLWQINSRNAAEFGGVDALKIPTINARAAYAVFQRAHGFCPWFTYERSCSAQHTGSYAQYIVQATLAAYGPNPWFVDAYQYALTWLNRPYLFGGCTPLGIDCSCYVQNVLRHVGINAPRTTREQIVWAQAIPAAQAVAGDLVFFDNTCTDCGANPTHEGMYIGNGQMINAGGTHVQIADITTGFYAQHNPRYARVRQ